MFDGCNVHGQRKPMLVVQERCNELGQMKDVSESSLLHPIFGCKLCVTGMNPLCHWSSQLLFHFESQRLLCSMSSFCHSAASFVHLAASFACSVSSFSHSPSFLTCSSASNLCCDKIIIIPSYYHI